MYKESTEITVTLSPSGRQFVALPNNSLLESGLGAGIALPYSCSDGRCGDCRAKVISGNVRKTRFHDFTLSESEKIAGVCLLCSNEADSNLTIEVSEANAVDDIPQQQLRGKLCHVEQLADMVIARFKITRGKALRFLPGQYLQLTLPGTAPWLLPIANCPCEPRFLEFHIPTHHTRECHLINNISRSDRVILDGPQGVFTHRIPAKTAENKLFIAEGQHFAAVKPLIEHVISQDNEQPCTMLWIATDQVGHYRHNLCRSWADAFDWFYYMPLANTDVLLPKISSMDLLSTDIYISASSTRREQIAEQLVANGANREYIVIDSTECCS